MPEARKENEDSMEHGREILTLGLEGEIFAVPAGIVREILDLIPVSLVPNAHPFVPGLINVRGKVVPLADLRVQFGMKPQAPTIDSRIVVVEINFDGEPVTVGVLADKVYEVTAVLEESVEQTPRIGMRWRPEFIKGIGKRGDDFIIILDIDRVFAARGDAVAA
jgi:purine-binding chemotaxis protein CheW